ncbi:hypothetical protein CCUS01_00470, partial [Colletotrichum cuscutae]
NSLIGFLLFFILKKGRKIRPIIDYKRLNEITKKNYYLLLLKWGGAISPSFSFF